MSLLMANRAIEKVSGGSPFPPVIEDGNSPGWYIADDLTTITKDASDFMSEWRDYLGSGHDLLQALGSSQAKWFLNDGVLLDGIDNVMRTLAFTLSQPTFIYAVFKQIIYKNNAFCFDGLPANSGAIRQSGGAPNSKAMAGVFSDPIPLPLNTFGVFRVLFNGSSSKFLINETATAGDYGAGNMGGFTIGAAGSVNAFFSNIQVKEILLRNIADSAQDEQDIYNYLAAKYSI